MRAVGGDDRVAELGDAGLADPVKEKALEAGTRRRGRLAGRERAMPVADLVALDDAVDGERVLGDKPRGRLRHGARQIELIQIAGRRVAAKDRAVGHERVAPVPQKAGMVVAQAARQTGQVDRRMADYHLCQYAPPGNPRRAWIRPRRSRGY